MKLVKQVLIRLTKIKILNYDNVGNYVTNLVAYFVLYLVI